MYTSCMPANQDSEPIQILNSALPISVPVYVPTSLKIWRYSLLIFGLALNIFLGILLWVYLTFPLFYFSLQQISYATLSESARMVITGVMVPNISYMLGILSGSWNFMRMRKQPNKNIAIAAEDVHVTISNTMDKTTYLYFCRHYFYCLLDMGSITRSSWFCGYNIAFCCSGFNFYFPNCSWSSIFIVTTFCTQKATGPTF
jgi:hypothetical protein